MSTYRAVRGFCYLEPTRHIAYITDLDGAEAVEFGAILAKVSRAIQKAMDAKLVYVYIYGGHIPHLHVHLAPHKDGDIYVDDVVRAEVKLDESALDPEEVKSLSESIGTGIADQLSNENSL
jgi:diadenosine tetraphosphate (Ap4A) HIT family hydrolase